MSVFDTLTELHRVCKEMRDAGIKKFLHLQDLMPQDHAVALRWANEHVVLIPYYERVGAFDIYQGFLVFSYQDLVTYLSELGETTQGVIDFIDCYKKNPTEILHYFEQRGIRLKEFSKMISNLPLEREIIRSRDAFFIDFIQTLMSVGYKVEFFQTKAQVTSTDKSSRTNPWPRKLSLRGGIQAPFVIVEKGGESCVEVVIDVVYAYI